MFVSLAGLEHIERSIPCREILARQVSGPGHKCPVLAGHTLRMEEGGASLYEDAESVHQDLCHGQRAGFQTSRKAFP